MIDIEEPTTAYHHQPRRSGAVTRAGRDAGYVLAMFTLANVGFWVFSACVLTTLLLLPTVIGAIAGVGSAFVIRALTDVDRRLAGWYLGQPIRGRYRKSSAPGMVALVKTVARDPRRWKDTGWVLGNSFAGFGLGLLAVVVSSLVITYISTPLWWWAVPHPHENYAVLNLGIYTVTSTSLALITTAIGLALVPVAIALNRGVASAHARMACSALRDY